MTEPGTTPARVEELGFGGVVRLGWQILQLDERAMDVARGPAVSMPLALAVAAIGGALSGLPAGLGGLLMGGILGVLGLALTAAIAHGLALVFGGDGSFEELMKVLSVGSLVRWAGCIPLVGILAHIWFAVIMGVSLRRVYGLPTATAALVVLLPAVLVLAGSVLLGLGLFLGGVALVG